MLDQQRDHGLGFELDKTYVPALAEVIGNDPATNGQFRYLTHDHLGSTRGVFDGTQASLGTFEYTPYGAPFQFSGPGDITRLFTGHDLDKVTGQYYAPFRVLDPTAGRWLKRDPLGMIDGPNMYGYVAGDPIGNFDPLGLECGPADDPVMDFLIPDNPLGCRFGEACKIHDRCYGGVPGGPSKSKEECDKEFLNNALKACESAPHYVIPTSPFSAATVDGRKVCEKLANEYYDAFNTKRAHRQFRKARGENPDGFEFNLTNIISDLPGQIGHIPP